MWGTTIKAYRKLKERQPQLTGWGDKEEEEQQQELRPTGGGETVQQPRAQARKQVYRQEVQAWEEQGGVPRREKARAVGKL